MPAPYVDTSALAKWYLNEPRSEDFAKYIQAERRVAISRLTVVELRCLLGRRRRARHLTAALEREILQAFQSHVQHGFLTVHRLEDHHALRADELIEQLKEEPLRTLDAFHLAIALDLGCQRIATADRVMATAATKLGICVDRFD
jgi:predicted nucleic acid-binding protein